MLEIPGEEAPTDPGLEMRKKQEIIAARQAGTRRTMQRIMGVILAGVMMLGSGLSYWYIQRQAEELVYDLDDVYIPKGLLGAAPPPVEQVESSGKATAGNAGKPRKAAPLADAPLPAAAKVASSAGLPATVKYVPPSSASGDAKVEVASGEMSSTGIGGADIAVFRVGDDVITDDEAIFRMAKEAIAAYGPQMETCAVQRIKQDESFGGAWKLQLTIQKAGTVSKVKVTPAGQSDAEFEACMQRAASSWKFAKIGHDFTFSKTYRFAASDF